MAIIGKIRNKSGLLVGFVGVTLVLFILSDYLGNRGNGSQVDNGVYGEVFGEEITAQEYLEEVNKIIDGRKAQGANDDQATQDQIHEGVWDMLVRKKMMAHELDKFGFVISQKELNDLLFGKNISPILTNPQSSYFKDSMGRFDVSQIIRFRQSLDQNPKDANQRKQIEESRKAWREQIEVPVKENRIEEKYFNMIQKAVYVTNAEVNYDHVSNQRKYKIKYVSARFSDIPDSTIKVNDSEVKAYYEKNKGKKRWEEYSAKRKYSYVEFPLIPSEKDIEASRLQIETKLKPFKESTNDSMFVMSYADTKMYNPMWMSSGSFAPDVDSLIMKADSGTVIGPYMDAATNTWKLTKVVDTKMEEEVQARHILFRPEADEAKLKARVDSVMKVIRKNKNFAEMAAKYGTDGTKTQGGDLGWFGRKAMVPEFEEASFNGKVGDLKVVKTQFGTHILEVTGKRTTAKVQVATIDVKIRPLAETDMAVRERAVKFLDSFKGGSEFQKAAQKMGLQVKEKELQRNERYIDPEKTTGGRQMGVWIHNASVSDVSDPKLIGNNYIVATVTGIWEKGEPAYDNVKELMKLEVIKEKKGKILEAKLKGARSIEDAATKAGKGIQDAELAFSAAVIPGVDGTEYKVIGTIFSMKNRGDLSVPIIGDNGVFVALLTDIIEAPALQPEQAKMQKQAMVSSKRQNVRQEVMIALREKAKVKDNRPVN